MRVEPLTDIDQIRAFLSADRGRHAYMLGDLCDPYWANAEFFGAFLNDELRAIVLKYAAFDPPPVITAGDSDGVCAILDQFARIERLSALVYHAQPEHLALVQHWYATPNPLAMWRMTVTPDQFQKPVPSVSARRLTPADAASAGAMYNGGDNPGEVPFDFHLPDFEDGIFYGVEENGQIMAVAGTHIISKVEKIGAVGYVFTHRAARGKGYATLCTGAVTEALFGLGIDLVALNVRQDNPPAIRAYENSAINAIRRSMKGLENASAEQRLAVQKCTQIQINRVVDLIGNPTQHKQRQQQHQDCDQVGDGITRLVAAA